MKSLSVSWIHLEFTIIFVASLWNHVLFRESTINSISVSRIHQEFTLWFANSSGIHYLVRVLTMNLLSVSRIHQKFTIPSANWLGILYLFCDFTMKSLQYESFITESQMTRFVLFQFCLSMRTVLNHRNRFWVASTKFVIGHPETKTHFKKRKDQSRIRFGESTLSSR